MATKTPSLLASWCGSGEIWTPETYHLSVRKAATVSVVDGQIEVRLPKTQIRFTAADIVEARSFRLPVRSLTLVFSLDSGHALVTLFRVPASVQDELAERAGFTIDDRRTWRTGLEARRDQRKYSLQGGR